MLLLTFCAKFVHYSIAPITHHTKLDWLEHGGDGVNTWAKLDRHRCEGYPVMCKFISTLSKWWFLFFTDMSAHWAIKAYISVCEVSDTYRVECLRYWEKKIELAVSV